MRAFDRPGRSVVYAGEAMVATSHPLATSTALDILRRGGNAVDAAIAAGAVLAVVEPAETGIGGDCFALLAKGGRLPPLAFNGSGKAPAAATLDWYLERGFETIPDNSPHAVTVPGAVDAWWQIHAAHGHLEWPTLLAPAIRYAEGGYGVHERVADEWQLSFSRLLHDPEAASLFLASAVPPTAGQVMRNPPLAATLRKIATEGRRAFYEGALAAAMVGHLRVRGGLHTIEDFAMTSGSFVEPISNTFRGRDIYQLPPNTQGVIALAMLRLLEAREPTDVDFLSAERVHVGIEAAKLAYGLRDRELGDMPESQALIDLVADPGEIAKLAAKIGYDRVHEAAVHQARDVANTVYLTVADSDRTVVSFINSIYHSFGAGICPPGTGVLLQNRGHSFRLQRGHPNAIGPGRRPMHTIIPAMAGVDGRVVLSFGVMGGDYQPAGHAHVLSALYTYGWGLQEACDAPRYLPRGELVEVESGIDASLRAALRELGHRPVPAAQPHGGAQLIAVDWQEGIYSGASDPRKDGLALGF